MAAAYTRRLAGPLPLPVVGLPLFTVPLGRVYVVRDILLLQGAAPGAIVVLSIGPVGVVANRVMRVATVNDTTHLFETRIVLNQGESLQGLSTTGLVNATIAGYDLSAV